MDIPDNNEIQKNLQLMRFEDYIAILKRRKMALIFPFVLVLTVAISLAYLLPSIYRSEATILIEAQEIPQDLVETTVTGFVQERIQGISKKLLTRENLWHIVEKLDLYSDYRSPENRSEIVSEMSKSTEIEMVETRTNERGKQGNATIAFKVAFEAKDPDVAQLVTNELASLYTEENKRLRSKHANEVSEFLNAEGDRLSKQITELESQLAEFKQNQQSQLPELMNLNLQLYEKTDSEIERTKEKIRTLEDRVNALQAELTITKPYQDISINADQKVLTESERRRLLIAEYKQLSTKYSAEHPDIIKLRRQIDALGGESSDSGAPVNPVYVSLRTQLNAASENLKSERAKLLQLNEKLSEFETRLFHTPVVERDYRLLSRDYENAKKKYDEIKDKQLEARLAIDLETSSKGQRFTIVQPANTPDTPVRPNRLGIAFLGFLLACAGGIGAVTIREYMDNTIYNARDLYSVFRAPPLVAIPNIPD